MRDNRVRLSVAARGEAPPPSTSAAVHLRYGTPMSEVRAAVLKANPNPNPYPNPNPNPNHHPDPNPTPNPDQVRAAVLAANPAARVVEIEAPHLKRLCRWLGTAEQIRTLTPTLARSEP